MCSLAAGHSYRAGKVPIAALAGRLRGGTRDTDPVRLRCRACGPALGLPHSPRNVDNRRPQLAAVAWRLRAAPPPAESYGPSSFTFVRAAARFACDRREQGGVSVEAGPILRVSGSRLRGEYAAEPHCSYSAVSRRVRSALSSANMPEQVSVRRRFRRHFFPPLLALVPPSSPLPLRFHRLATLPGDLKRSRSAINSHSVAVFSFYFAAFLYPLRPPGPHCPVAASFRGCDRGLLARPQRACCPSSLYHIAGTLRPKARTCNEPLCQHLARSQTLGLRAVIERATSGKLFRRARSAPFAHRSSFPSVLLSRPG